MKPSLVARLARMTPSKLHIGLPVLIMALFYWISSVPGTPLPDDPAFYALFQWMPSSVQNALHFPAFTVLGLAWCWALAAWLRSQSTAAISAFAIASAYAVLDEWHQSLVPGRFASLTDIAFDVGGAVFGIWLWIRLGLWRRQPPDRQAPL